MFQRIVVTALLAGFVAGLFAAGVQRLELIPLIERAEIYERAASDHSGHDHATAQPDTEWEPEPGLERTAYTVLTDVLTGIGFALILSAAITLARLARLAGHAVDARRGLLWGAAGFAVFTLAPSLGLPPLPPGVEAAELLARQSWWAGTALATAGGLALLVFCRPLAAKLLGAVLLALPHIIGAPHPAQSGGSVPGDLAAQFALASIATAAAFWLVLGSLTGWLYRRFG